MKKNFGEKQWKFALSFSKETHEVCLISFAVLYFDNISAFYGFCNESHCMKYQISPNFLVWKFCGNALVSAVFTK